MDETMDLLFNFEAIVFLSKNGLNVMDSESIEKAMTSPESYMLLMKAGLRNENPEITDEQVMDIANKMKPQEVFQQVSEALIRDIAPNEEESDPEDSETTG